MLTFHLGRLVDEGLLEARLQRLTDRTGPGAGRPAKLHRRAPGELAVSLPQRAYGLAGELMAAAIDASATHGVPVLKALADAAARRGREVAARASAAADRDDEPVPVSPGGAGREGSSAHVAHRPDRGDDGAGARSDDAVDAPRHLLRRTARLVR